MRLPNQTIPTDPEPLAVARRESRGVEPSCGCGGGPRRTAVTGLIAQPPPRPTAVPDHTVFEMLLSGCTCISPNCVAMSCPAECVEGGKFVC